MSETQVRRVLHQAGFKTFTRPKGIPNSWEIVFYEKGGGMKYQHKIIGKDSLSKIKTEVRVMPGNPDAKWFAQRKSYVKHQVNGIYLDKNGTPVPSSSSESHIPLKEYNFEKLSKWNGYE